MKHVITKGCLVFAIVAFIGLPLAVEAKGNAFGREAWGANLLQKKGKVDAFGNAEREGEKLYVIESTEDEPAWFSKTLDVKGKAGHFAVLMSYVKTDGVRKTDEGKAVLRIEMWGKDKDGKRKVLATDKVITVAENDWQKVAIAEYIPQGVEQMKVYMQQENTADERDGIKAMFWYPALYTAATQEKADYLVKEYTPTPAKVKGLFAQTKKKLKHYTEIREHKWK